jgi:hypothetical protein
MNILQLQNLLHLVGLVEERLYGATQDLLPGLSKEFFRVAVTRNHAERHRMHRKEAPERLHLAASCDGVVEMLDIILVHILFKSIDRVAYIIIAALR